MLKRALLLLLAMMLAAPVAQARPGSQYRDALRTRGGAVATESPLAGRAAVAVLDEGGNAMDAAVAAVFAVGATRPELCGIGGGGFLVYRRADGRTESLDFREQAPAQYTYSAGVSLGPQLIFGTGHNVVGVPGIVAGMAAALQRYGTISLARAIAPAEKAARAGFLVTPEQAGLFASEQPRLRLFEESADVYLKNGLTAYEAGDRLVLTDYANSLAAVAKDGPRAFYSGPIAAAIVASMPGSPLLAGDRGTMTLEDLAAYKPIWRPALTTTYRGAQVATVPPPTSGGTAIVETLNLLEGFPAPADALSADRLHLMAEAQKVAWADRAEYLGDPRFTDVPTAKLTSKAYADRRRTEISPSVARAFEAGAGPIERAAHTTHVSVIDGAGNAAAITCTIEQIAGSAVVAPGTGFLLNNELTDFNEPGTGTEANEPAPGKRPRSSMSPVIVARRGQPVLAVGGAGGPSIIGGVLNTISNVLDHGMDVGHAVDEARGDARGYCEGDGLQLCLEDPRVDNTVIADLESRGHVVRRLGEYSGAVVQAVGVDPATGERLAAFESRAESGPAVQATGPRPRLRIEVRPQEVSSGSRVRIRFSVRDDRGIAVAGATVRFAGGRTRTGADGRATLTRRLQGSGVRQAVARKPGSVPATVEVRVRRARQNG